MTDERGGDGAAEATDAGPPLLAVDGLTVAYGAVVAIRDVSLTVAPGEIVAALGPNGAGKTTLLRTLAGALKPQHGSVTFDGDALTGLSPETVVRRGVALVPEGRHVFGNLTVAENLTIGGIARKDRDGLRADTERWLARFPILGERANQTGRHALGRRAAAARDRAGADVTTRACSCSTNPPWAWRRSSWTASSS